jgi:Tfp pilus assembly protein PilN
MIQINLLPDELRRGGRSSPRALALLFVASLLCFGALGTTGFLWFNVRADRQARVDIAKDQLDHLSPQAKYADSLAQEKAEFEKRNKTISEIASSRIVWTRKFDRLGEIIAHDSTQRGHRIWLSSLDVDARTDSNRAGVEIKGHSSGSDLDGVSNFHEDLKTDPVFKEGFVAFTTPESKLGDEDDLLEPPTKREFSFAIRLPEKEKKAPVRKPSPAKKPAATGS